MTLRPLSLIMCLIAGAYIIIFNWWLLFKLSVLRSALQIMFSPRLVFSPPDLSFLSGASCDSPSSNSPPLAISPPAATVTTPGVLTCASRAFASCLPPPPPPPPPQSPYPLSSLSSLSLSPAASHTQRLYISPQSPFY